MTKVELEKTVVHLAETIEGLTETVNLLMEVAVAAKLVCDAHEDQDCYMIKSLREKLGQIDAHADKRLLELGITSLQPRAQA